MGDDVGDWLKDIVKIDFFETSEVSPPMMCQKMIAKDGKKLRFFWF